MIGFKKVSDYIKDKYQTSAALSQAADSQEPIGKLDVNEHIKNYTEQMPHITGPKAFVLSAPVIIDEPDVPDNTSL